MRCTCHNVSQVKEEDSNKKWTPFVQSNCKESNNQNNSQQQRSHMKRQQLYLLLLIVGVVVYNVFFNWLFTSSTSSSSSFSPTFGFFSHYNAMDYAFFRQQVTAKDKERVEDSLWKLLAREDALESRVCATYTQLAHSEAQR